jgi:hypothetical protein
MFDSTPLARKIRKENVEMVADLLQKDGLQACAKTVRELLEDLELAEATLRNISREIRKLEDMKP